MPRRASAKRYAHAAFELAEQRDLLDSWAADLRSVNEVLREEQLRVFMEHAKVPLARKVQAIKEAFQETDPMIQNLLCLLVSRGLVDLVQEVEEWYQHLLNQHRGREEVEVVSAVDLDDSERERIAHFLTGMLSKEVVLHVRVDPAILGGLVIKVGDRLIDGAPAAGWRRWGNSCGVKAPERRFDLGGKVHDYPRPGHSFSPEAPDRGVRR